ncbi:MAG: glucose-6-phosphate dehydrogenase [Anaerolineae bacterium]
MSQDSSNTGATIVIFGASGDLTQRKLIPALYNLFRKKRLPDRFNIVGVSRTAYSHEDFRTEMKQGVKEFSGETFRDEYWNSFAEHIWYVAGDASKVQQLDEVRKFLESKENGTSNRLYYLSVAPTLYPVIINNLGELNMNGENGSWRRIIIEKPFGTDLETALDLNKIVHHNFDENQVYRIDHYLGKETAQNILFLRFANTIFEPVWNRNYVEYIQITVAEQVDVGHRAAYYDQAGVVRDMFQNHILQLLALVTMEPPSGFNATSLRNEKVKLLSAIPPIELQNTVRAQYADYLQTDGVMKNSQTPTYAAMKLYIENWRWQGVPFYLRSGKALRAKTSQIRVRFQRPPGVIFNTISDESCTPNTLTICIQPDEGIHLNFQAKLPDSNHDTREVDMEFNYAKAFGEQEIPEAYERLLLDALNGDPSLFTRSDEIEALWKIIDPLLSGWETGDAPAVTTYAHGSWGPTAADELLRKDNHKWHLGCIPNGGT